MCYFYIYNIILNQAYYGISYKGKEVFCIRNRKVASFLKQLKQNAGLITTMDILGNQHLVIDGCKNILEYTTSTIKIATPDFTLKVMGVNLTLKNLTVDSACIEGTIVGIEFLQS